MSIPSPDGVQVVLTLSTVGALWFGWAKVAGPRVKRQWNRLVGFVEAIAGRDAIVDKASGIEKAPAVPPLGVRLASIDDTMQKLVVVIESNHDAHKRIDSVVADVAVLKVDVDGLKTAAVERIVTKSESAEMWRAIGNGDLIDGDAPDQA